MLVRDFNDDIIDMDIAQFALAITLDFEGEYRASNAILGFYNKQVGLATEEDKPTRESKSPYFNNSDNIIERGRIRDNLYNKLLYNAQQRKISFLKVFIAYLYSNKCIYAVNKNRVYTTVESYSLKDLLVQTTIEKLYDSCIKLLFKTKPKDLLGVYMRTHRFRNSFVRWLRIKYPVDNFGRKNNFDDAKVNALLETVIHRIKLYSLNQYNIDSMQPDKYIFFALNNFFKDSAKLQGSEESDVTKFYQIMNSYGQDRDVQGEDSDGSATALSFVGIDLNKKVTNFNFVEVASRICKASQIIFDYKKSSTAYYDLFSKYRDDILEESAGDNKNLLRSFVGCSFNLYKRQDNFTIDSDMDLATLKQKFEKRKHYLTLMNILITHGVDISNLANLYRKQFEYTNTLSARDGFRLYKTSFGSKRTETNGEIFRTLYDGMLAVKEFLEFIESDENTYGITVSNFNTDVFRSMEYIRRFKTIEEYVKYGDSVKKILDEAKSTETSGMEENTSLYTNDEIYTMITTNELFLQNPIFRSLQSVSIGYINEVLYKRNIQSRNQEFFTKFDDIYSSCQARDLGKWGIYGSSDEIPREYCSNLVMQCIMELFKSLKGNTFDTPETFRRILIFLTNLERLMTLEGHPVVQDGIYTITYGDEDPFSYLDDGHHMFNDANGDFNEGLFNNHRKFRGVFVKTIFDNWFPEHSDIALSEKFRILLTINRVIQILQYRLHSLYKVLNSNKGDIDLAYINATTQIDILNIHLPITRLSTLNNLSGEGGTLYQVHLPINQKVKLDTLKDRLVLKYVNQYLIGMKDEFEFLNSLSDAINTTFKLSYAVSEDHKMEKLLKEAHNNIIAQYGYKVKRANINFTDSLDLRLKSCRHNDNGILLVEYRPFSFNEGKSFIHYKGFVITIDLVREKTMIRSLTEDDFGKYIAELEIYNV